MKLDWKIPEQFPSLHSRQTHIWCVDLASVANSKNRDDAVLSISEKERARQFILPKVSEYFVVTRNILRRLLGNYLELNPKDVKIFYTEKGKPFIKDNLLQFNVSHSNEKALFAFAMDDLIGVDIEFKKNMKSSVIENIARRFFSKHEEEQLLSLPKKERERFFFECWTCKEAFVKAIGEGLSFSLNKFDVDVSKFGEDKSRLLNVNDDRYNAEEWFLDILPMQSNYTAAFAVKNRGQFSPPKLFFYPFKHI